MDAKKRIGRPPKADAVRKRKNQTFRIRDQTFARLVAVAGLNQRSVSEEIEERLERSFDIEQTFGGSASFKLLLSYARVLQGIEGAEGARWYENSEAANLVMARAVLAMREAMIFEASLMQPATEEEAAKALAAFNDLPARMPTASLMGSEEAARSMAGKRSAIRNHPADLHDRAEFDEIMSDRPRDGGDENVPVPKGDNPNDGAALSPAPSRRRTRALGV